MHIQIADRICFRMSVRVRTLVLLAGGNRLPSGPRGPLNALLSHLAAYLLHQTSKEILHQVR